MRQHLLNISLLIGGFLIIFTNVFYFLNGYSPLLLLTWLLSILLIAIYIFKKTAAAKRQPLIHNTDLIILTILILISIPIYLFSIYTIPYQINTDEITIMIVEKSLTKSFSTDVFGLGHYFDFPSMIFIIFGTLGNLIGGINLFNMRFIHACFGILITIFAYLFFRQSLSRSMAIGATLILSFNHSLIALSRMSMRDNSGLLVELVSLFFLIRGLKNKDYFSCFFGGCFAGLAYYVYFPARATIFIWGGSLLLLLLLRLVNFSQILKFAGISLVGFLIIVIPLFIAIFKTPPDIFHYQKQQWLFFEEGQKMQQNWIGATSIKEGITKNIISGLTTFNNKESDKGNIYPNPGHGFVDPLTGILLWLGLIMILIKRRKDPQDVIVVIGFMSLLLAFSFVVNKAPNYTRLLITLPFVAYLSIGGIAVISKIIQNIFGLLFIPLKKLAPIFVAVLIISIIVISNLLIFNDFIEKGFTLGNDVGGTARFVESRALNPNLSFYLVASQGYPYYSWGEESQWRDWLGFFTSENQSVRIINPKMVINDFKTPFVLFFSERLLNELQPKISVWFPDYKLYKIKPDGSLLAIEVK
jgi:4-amino-4-deoxy-L-arabinose transferase-like glycosyltransferase